MSIFDKIREHIDRNNKFAINANHQNALTTEDQQAIAAWTNSQTEPGTIARILRALEIEETEEEIKAVSQKLKDHYNIT